MRALAVFIVLINLFGCAATQPTDDTQSVANRTHQTAACPWEFFIELAWPQSTMIASGKFSRPFDY